jgi:hypothetical protein
MPLPGRSITAASGRLKIEMVIIASVIQTTAVPMVIRVKTSPALEPKAL